MIQFNPTQFVAALCAPLLLAIALNAAAVPNDIEKEFDRGAAAHRMRDYQTAYKIWLSLAERGQVDAQYNIARMLQDGDGAPKNPSEAAKWFRKAAEHGDKESQYYLGLMYLRGEGVAADETKAHEWFVKNHHEHMHQHTAQYQQWQKQARALIEERDRREAYAAIQRNSAQIMAELERRASTGAAATPEATVALAANDTALH
ncbi:MAG: tetratricopeptide repeat protein [Sulfuricella sp.]